LFQKETEGSKEGVEEMERVTSFRRRKPQTLTLGKKKGTESLWWGGESVH